MFYSQFILAKKGPLGTIWIAAHLERKLRKNQVADTDIGVSVDSILFPDVPIALRLSSHLLLGVVRIYSRKVNYLFHDCSEALLKVKQAFRSAAVDLPPEESTAPYHSITLPETFDLDDFELPDSENFQGNYVDHHVSTREQITLQDTLDGVVYSSSQFGLDERFGDGDASQLGLDFDEELFLDKTATPRHTATLLDLDDASPHDHGQPMTPFTPMDIDDDDENKWDEDRTASASEGKPSVAIAEKFDTHSQDQQIIVHNSHSFDTQIHGPDVNGKSFPCEDSERSLPGLSKELVECAPSTPRLVEQVALSNGHVEDPSSSLITEISVPNPSCSLQLESEYRDQTESLADENLGNQPSKQYIHMKDSNSIGECSLLSTRISETDVLRMPNEESFQVSNGKQRGDSPPVVVAPATVSFEVGPSVSSPTSVLVEQPKPIFPAVESVDKVVIMEKTETSQDGVISNQRPSCSDAEQTLAEGGAAPNIHSGRAIAPALLESCAGLSPAIQEVQAKFISPASESSEKTLAAPDTLQEPVTLEDRATGMNLNISDVQHTDAGGLGITLKSGAGCALLEISDNLPPAGVSGHSNSTVSSDLVLARSDSGFASKNGFSEQQASAEVCQAGDLHVSCPSALVLPSLADSLFGIDPQEPDTVDAISNPEYTGVHNLFGPEKTGTGGHFIRACNFRTNETSVVFPGDVDTVAPTPALSRENEHPRHFAVTSDVEGAVCHQTSFRDNSGDAHKAMQFFQGQGTEAGYFGNSNSAISKDNHDENLNISVSWGFQVPAPEMLLSAQEAVGAAPIDVLGGSTVEKEVSSQRQTSADGLNVLAGKKRRSMDGTQFLQDTSSGQLFGVPWSNRTLDSIPDDNDLLSSILVGRKSSALKLRSTPTLEGPRLKRPRATPGVRLPKRKVLMDDTLVMHGDTIRQQLTSTEDIRRIRKKAPCTRPEIWMIQKHLLEDEVFSEPLFSGLSDDLIGLHNRVTQFKESETSVTQAVSVIKNRIELSGSTHPTGESSSERMHEPAVGLNDGDTHELAATPVQVEKQFGEEHHPNSFECDTQSQMRPIIDATVLNLHSDSHLGNASTMNIDRQENKDADIADHAGISGAELELLDAAVSRDGLHVAASSLTESLPMNSNNKGKEVMSQDEENFDILSVKKNICAVDEASNEADDVNISVKVIEEGSVLAEGVSIVKDESVIQKLTGSSLFGLASQNVMHENEVEICGSVDRCDSTSLEGVVIGMNESIVQRPTENGAVDVVLQENNAQDSGVNICGQTLAQGVTTRDDLVDMAPQVQECQVYIGSTVAEITEPGFPTVVPQNLQETLLDVCESSSSQISSPVAKFSIGNEDDASLDVSTFHDNVNRPLGNMPEASRCPIDLTVVTEDVIIEGPSGELGFAVRDEIVGEMKNNEAKSTTGHVAAEELQRVYLCQLDVNQDAHDAVFDEGKNPCIQEETIDAETAVLDNNSPIVTDEFGNTLDENHTEFLNFDDDEDVDEGDPSIPSTEDTQLLDSSGWSSRTRGVARYLQTLFDNESGHERKVLPMDKLLSGKTRKEASRMFFETLVLKTRDYIHVEQDDPFASISINSTSRLMKSSF